MLDDYGYVRRVDAVRVLLMAAVILLARVVSKFISRHTVIVNDDDE